MLYMRDRERERKKERERDKKKERQHVCVGVRSVPVCVYALVFVYGVAMDSRLLQIIGLFCRISSLL